MGNILQNSLDVTYEDFLKGVFGVKPKPEQTALLAGIRALVKEARIRFIGGRPRKRTVDDKQMALPGF